MKLHRFTVACKIRGTDFEVTCESGTAQSVGTFVPNERIDCPKSGCAGKIELGNLPGKIVSVSALVIGSK
jgi:hypothetical protein